MIVGLELENIGPYEGKVSLDFRINKRDKTDMDSVCILPDGEMVTKIVGIIAGNAYGKTTLLDSLKSIGGFIDNPLKKQKINGFLEDIDNDEIKKKFIDYTKIQLLPINKKANHIGNVSVDMYIDTSDELSGYYTYSIKYDDEYLKNGVLEEKLMYRKKYDSKKLKEIFITFNNTESEIGYNKAYRNNIINNLDKKAKVKFEEKMKYCDAFYSKYIDDSSTLEAENYIFAEAFIIAMLPDDFSFLKGFVKIVDNDVKDIVVKDEDSKNKKMYFVYENYKLRYDYISSATKKMCGIALSLYKACKSKGVFLIDELDNSLNKNVAKFVLDLYRKNIAKNTSQIIFTTNNAEIMENFRRDQIFLIEKKFEGNRVTKYLDFIDEERNKKSRKDWSFSRAYNDNVIKNYPTSISTEELNSCLDKIL